MFLTVEQPVKKTTATTNDKKLKTLDDWEEAVKAANQSSDRTLWIKALSPSGRKIAFAIELDEK